MHSKKAVGMPGRCAYLIMMSPAYATAVYNRSATLPSWSSSWWSTWRPVVPC